MRFTIAELKTIIDKMPDDGVVVINGEVVNGAQIITGRVRDDGYLNENFYVTPKGKVMGIAFTRCTEISTGEVVHQHKI